MVPRGYTAIMYGGRGFNDEVQRFEGRYLDDKTQLMVCQDFNMANDAVSSLRIVKAPAAIGYWQGITSTETQDYSFHVGINYAVSHGSTFEIQHRLTHGMQMGLDFGWLNFGSRVEHSVAYSLSYDV
jgi:hypothetical protein